MTARRRVTCPDRDCGKVLVSAERAAGLVFPTHRRPKGGTCWKSGQPVRIRDLVHPCKRCRELPLRPADLSTITDADNDYVGPFRPSEPRPIKARGYCASHLREVDAEQRERKATAQRQTRFGLDALAQRELRAAQGGACACGVVHNHSRKRPAIDHDHDREAQCVAAGRHEAGRACKRCVRGELAQQCNEVVVGRFTPDQLRRLADYIDNPTAQRLGWWDQEDGMYDSPSVATQEARADARAEKIENDQELYALAGRMLVDDEDAE